MAKYVYTGDQTLVFPTLGLTVNNGDVFDAPAGLVADGVSINSSKKVLGSDEPTEPTPVVELSEDNATTTDGAERDDLTVEPVTGDVADDATAGVVDLTAVNEKSE